MKGKTVQNKIWRITIGCKQSRLPRGRDGRNSKTLSTEDSLYIKKQNKKKFFIELIALPRLCCLSVQDTVTTTAVGEQVF